MYIDSYLNTIAGINAGVVNDLTQFSAKYNTLSSSKNESIKKKREKLQRKKERKKYKNVYIDDFVYIKWAERFNCSNVELSI